MKIHLKLSDVFLKDPIKLIFFYQNLQDSKMETKVSHYKNLIIKTILSDEVLVIEAVDILTRLVYLQEWNVKENNLIDFKKLCGIICGDLDFETSIGSSENEVTIKCGCVILNVKSVLKYSISDSSAVTVTSHLWRHTKECNFQYSYIIVNDLKKIHPYSETFVIPQKFKYLTITFCIPYIMKSLSCLGKAFFKMCLDTFPPLVSKECDARDWASENLFLKYVGENIQTGEHQINLFVLCENSQVIIPCHEDSLKDKNPNHRGYIEIIGE